MQGELHSYKYTTTYLDIMEWRTMLLVITTNSLENKLALLKIDN